MIILLVSLRADMALNDYAFDDFVDVFVIQVNPLCEPNNENTLGLVAFRILSSLVSENDHSNVV